jgi:hypothetical protein
MEADEALTTRVLRFELEEMRFESGRGEKVEMEVKLYEYSLTMEEWRSDLRGLRVVLEWKWQSEGEERWRREGRRVAVVVRGMEAIGIWCSESEVGGC